MPLRVSERILAIRLMGKVNTNPAAAEKLGIVIVKDPGDLSHSNSDNDKS